MIIFLHLSKQGLKRMYLLDDTFAKNAQPTETKAKITSDDRFSPPIQMFSLNEMISINHMDLF